MIVLKYKKTGTSKFISHIEVLRHMERIVRRAGIPVNFSNGFNPHALLFFSPPCVLGISSKAEYLAIDTDINPKTAFENYNINVPESIKAEKYFVSEKKPNLQAKVVAADYIFDTPFDGIKFDGEVVVSFMKKGEVKTQNVTDMIYETFDVDGKLGIKLASGNKNLRPDRILPYINEKFNRELLITDVEKTNQYVWVDERYIDVDDYLENKF